MGSFWRAFIEEFNKFSQIGMILEYQEQFEYLRSLMNADNPTLLERFFIGKFINGLKLELQPMIRLLKPCALNQAFEQTLLQE